MRRTILLGLLLLIQSHTPLLGETEWKPSAEVRHRFEISNKDFSKEVSSRSFNLLRSRLGIAVMPSEDIEAFLQFQDSRVFGEEPGTLVSTSNVDLHQGYVAVKDLFGKPVDLKLGRMEVLYGPERLIGPVGWHNVGRSFDGGIVNFHPERISMDFFSFTEVESLEAGNEGDRFVQGIYTDLDIVESYVTQVFWIWQREIPASELNRHTAGFYASRKHTHFHHETEFAYQSGTIMADREQDVKAFMAALNVGMGFPEVTAKPDVEVGVDYLSGDGDLTDSKYKVFDTLYATNHKYYGYMDFFLNIPRDTWGLGLMDAHARVSTVASEKTKARVAFHVFNAAEEYTHADGSTSKLFGSELDGTVIYEYNDSVTFAGGASLFVPGDVFKDKRGSDNSHWFYVMTRFKI
jgi:hypothetical protein